MYRKSSMKKGIADFFLSIGGLFQCHKPFFLFSHPNPKKGYFGYVRKEKNTKKKKKETLGLLNHK